MTKFEKVSEWQFNESRTVTKYTEDKITPRVFGTPSPLIDQSTIESYDDIILPKRATKHSAGYDFFSPISFTLRPGDTIRFSTGIRVLMPPDMFLAIFPRSGLGFKYRLQLDNTVGIIDADYANAANEGNIAIKITNDARDGSVLQIEKGQAIAQGILLRYDITDDDDATAERVGGLGSTGGTL